MGPGRGHRAPSARSHAIGSESSDADQGVSTLDPGLTSDTYSSEVISNIYEGLVRYKKKSTGVESSLAVKWSVDNEGKRWVFKLRKGVLDFS